MTLKFGAALILTAFLSACSGGGSGGGSEIVAADPLPVTETEPVSPTPFPGEKFSLVFDEENTPLVLGFGLIMPKIALELAHSHAKALLRPLMTAVDSTAESYRAFCQRPDGFRTSNEDPDNNAVYSSGDTVHFVLDDCIANQSGELISGSSSIEISSFNIASNGEVYVEGRINLINFSVISPVFDNVAVPFSGSYEFTFQVDSAEERVGISSGQPGDELLLTDGADTVTMRDFSAYKTAPYDQSEHALGFTHRVEGSIVGGSYGCASVGELLGTRRTGITGCDIDCRGREEQQLRVTQPQGGLVFLEGEVLGILETERLISEPLLNDPLFQIADFQADLYADQLQLDVASLAHDSKRSRVLVATSRESTLYPNSLLAINIDSLQIEQTLQFDGPLTGLWITPSGDGVYASERNEGMALRIDLEAFSVVDSVTLDPSEKIGRTGSNGPVVPYLADLAFYLGSETDFVAVLARVPVSLPGYTPEHIMTAAYVNGVELPETLDFNSTPHQVSFPAPGTVLGFSASTPYTITVDANGLTVTADPINGQSGWQRTVIDMGDKILAGGTIYSKTDYSALSSFNATSSEVAYSQTTSRLYTLSGGFLSSFDSNRLTRLAYYRTPLPRSGSFYADDLLAAGNKLFIGQEGKLLVIDEASIADQHTAPCIGAITQETGVEGSTSRAATCIFTNAAYDASRDLVYAGVDPDQGRFGNSIAVIDPASAAVTNYIELTATPRELAVSATGAYLYVVTTENRILILDPSTGQVMSNTPLPRLPEPASLNDDLHYQHILSVSASPTIDEELVVSLSSQHGSVSFPDRNILLRNAEFILDNVVEGQQVPFAGFNQEGDLFGVRGAPGNSQQTNTYQYAVDGSGLSIASTTTSNLEFLNHRKIENFLTVGGVPYGFFANIRLNLTDGAWTELYSYPRATEPLATTVDAENGELLWLETNTGDFSHTCYLRRYDIDGNMLASFTFPPSPGGFSGCPSSQLFTAGSDVIGFLDKSYSLEFYPASLLAD